MKTAHTNNPATAPANAGMTPLTADQKAAVRRFLDARFDDSRGCYIDGYSDQKVGEEAKVGWAHVKAIREAAYGPIREAPELAELRHQIAAFGEFARTEIKQLSDKLDERAAALQRSYDDLRKKLGIV